MSVPLSREVALIPFIISVPEKGKKKKKVPKLMFMERKGKGGKEENEEMAGRDRGRMTKQARPLSFYHHGLSTCE